MKLLALLSFFVVITTRCNALLCFDAKTAIVIPLDNFSLNDFMKIIKNFSSTNGHEKCLVEIQINYGQEILNVLFGSIANSNSLTTNSQIYIDTYIILNQPEIHMESNNIMNNIRFICNTNDCNRQFVFDHLEWLLEVEYNDLVSNISPLLINKNEKTDKCIFGEQNQIQLCPTGICYLEYSMSTDQIRYECENDPDIQPALHIRTYFTIQEDHNREQMAKINFTINYWCQLDGCNNKTIATQIITIIEENYNLFEIKDILDLAYIEYWLEEEIDEHSETNKKQ
ncbi:unnamed protein product [Rotaria sordida]|uniref:Uncharacterized protein n=1 Tax=Rotaria sordida TaxID=392033 RepID=A0A818QMP9_9BILA|nr:unnamed protein product [Rotaria sordida]CAF3641676.1 unnamed protein product [Rotaria sordida]